MGPGGRRRAARLPTLVAHSGIPSGVEGWSPRELAGELGGRVAALGATRVVDGLALGSKNARYRPSCSLGVRLGVRL